MESTPIGDSIALVVRLQETADGRWCLQVDGSSTVERVLLAPVTLIMHFWRANDNRVLRGTIQMHGSEHVATIQGNAQLLELIRAWLLLNRGESEQDRFTSR